jgi:acyl-coenzyme A thioesterase PaaI-like protein
LNHLNTVHACALATAAEYASGLCVLSALGVGGMRLIMSDLHMTYVRRAESACLATAVLPEDQLATLTSELTREGRASLVLHSKVADASGVLVAEAQITWHVKRL